MDEEIGRIALYEMAIPAQGRDDSAKKEMPAYFDCAQHRLRRA